MRRVALAAVVLSAAVLTQVAGAGRLASPHVVLFVDDGGSVATVRADGRGLRFLAGDGVSQAIWAPDGTRVAYWGFNRNLSVLEVRDGATRDVVPGLVVDALWSPDGRWILAERRRGTYCHAQIPCQPVRYALYRVHPDGSALRRITSWERDGISPQGWSPDSRRLVAIAHSVLVLLDLNGSVVTAIPGTGAALYAAWSPDGQWIAYSRSQGGSPPNGPLRGLWLVKPDGSGLHQLTSGTQLGPVWSPDGRRIAFTEIREKDGQYVIGTVDVATGVQTPLVRDDRYVDESPSWSPDGNWLVFNRRPNVDGNKDQYLWVVNAHGTRAREISHHAYGRAASWKPR